VKHLAKPAGQRSRQRGAATLVVVMVLFFIVSLMAAYTGRNMIFEQKTSANQYRSTQAFEAAEAGVEWALSMLNGGKLNDECGTSPTAARSFRERYLQVDAVSGLVQNIDPATGAPAVPYVAPTLNLPTCVFNGTEWKCKCPYDMALGDPDATPVPSTYSGPLPAFRVRLVADIVRPGILRIESNGCTRLDNACLDFPAPRGGTGDGLANISAIVALKSGLVSPPAAAVTVRGTLEKALYAVPLRITNPDLPTAGVTVQSGNALSAGMRSALQLQGPMGTPGEFTLVEEDPSLASVNNAGRMFATVFGMRRLAYEQAPATLKCSQACDTAQVAAFMAANPHRTVWIEGNLTLDSNVGDATQPALLVVSGDVDFSVAGVDLIGALYLSGSSANITVPGGASRITGAVMAETDLNLLGGGNLTITYDAAVLGRLRNTYGSFVRVPGGWRDWRFSP
jgi:hypothetical protein